ncbi:MAG: twin-arginine translocation signal domain-containing protein [Gemmatimonadota bacterium]|nr:MAG: twin-arginine translocation signal domain-containing protein [Gemmatimonadota bacterium]
MTDDRAASVPIASAEVRPGMSRRDFLKTGLLGTMAAPVLLGCTDFTSTPAASPWLTSRPGSPTITPANGLSELGLGSPRDGLLYVPESYSPDVPAPLFVALHGAGGSGDSWASYHERAEARGMILLAPDARSSTWDLVRGHFGPDVEFLDRALQHTFERCLIDPARLALGGFSDGASYALSLGLCNGDLFSHLVAYSPGFQQGCGVNVEKPQIYVSHGTRDRVLPVTTTRDRIVPNLRSAGWDVTYEEFDGGHVVPAEISESALDWFLGDGGAT